MKVDYSAASAGVRSDTGPAPGMPPGFKHALLGLAQLSLFLLVCAAVGVFTNEDAIQEFAGHTGLAAAIIASGVATAVGPTDMTRLVRLEGWLAIAGGGGYVLGDTFFVHPPWGVFDGAGQSEQFHIGLTALVAAIGLFTVLYVRALRRPTALHVVLLAAAYSLLITGHHQHAASSSMAHSGSALFAAIAAIFRVMDRRVEAGICIILTGYLLFAGQTGFGAFTALYAVEPVPWLCGWAAAGAFAGAMYLAAFPEAARRTS